MTREQECVKELCMILDDITEKAKHHDFSLFRVSGISGCDRYQGAASDMSNSGCCFRKIR